MNSSYNKRLSHKEFPKLLVIPLHYSIFIFFRKTGLVLFSFLLIFLCCVLSLPHQLEEESLAGSVMMVLKVSKDCVCAFSVGPEAIQHHQLSSPAKPISELSSSNSTQIELIFRSIFRCSSRYKFSQVFSLTPFRSQFTWLGTLVLSITVSLGGGFPCLLTS